jgi:hypothetical protein
MEETRAGCMLTRELPEYRRLQRKSTYPVRNFRRLESNRRKRVASFLDPLPLTMHRRRRHERAVL